MQVLPNPLPLLSKILVDPAARGGRTELRREPEPATDHGDESEM